VFVELFKDFLSLFGIQNLSRDYLIRNGLFGHSSLLMLVVADFIQWNVPSLLIEVRFNEEFFIKCIHSVRRDAVLRLICDTHWMRRLFIKNHSIHSFAMIGFGLDDFFLFATSSPLQLGHLNHANINLTYWTIQNISSIIQWCILGTMLKRFKRSVME